MAIRIIETWTRDEAAWVSARPSAGARIAAWVLLGAGALAIVVVLLPLALLVLGVGVAALLLRGALRLGARLSRPNGPLDGRRNVRVVMGERADGA